MARRTPRVLAFFDFDHTIVAKNSDVVLRNLLPDEVKNSQKLQDLRTAWTKYMAEVFRLLPQHGFDKNRIVMECATLVPSPGILDLFKFLKSIQADVNIVSDANTVIISSWQAANLPDFDVTVYTNPANWNDDGVLEVEPLENQTSCPRCPTNLCKGTFVRKFLEEKSNYDITCYVGDGRNDLCPSLELKATDLVFPRKGFALEGLLQKTPPLASVHVWENAGEIRTQLNAALTAMGFDEQGL